MADDRWSQLRPSTLRLLVDALACGLRATAQRQQQGSSSGGQWLSRWAAARQPLAVRLGSRQLLLAERAEHTAEHLSPEQRERLRQAAGVRSPVLVMP